MEIQPVSTIFGGLGPSAQNVDAAKIVQAGIEVGGVGDGPDENGVGITDAVFVHKITVVATLLSGGVPGRDPAVVADAGPFSLAVVRADEDIDIGFADVGGAVGFSGEMVTGIIDIAGVVGGEAVEGTAPLGVHVPLVHFGDSDMVPGKGHVGLDIDTIEIGIGDHQVFRGAVSSSDIVPGCQVHPSLAGNRRGSDLRGGPDELVVFGGDSTG